MKILITTIAAVLLAGCGGGQQTSSPVETEPTEPVAEPIVEAEPTAEINKTANPQADRALRDAITKGDVEAVKQQLAAGADVNMKAPRGWAPLHNAANADHKEIVELLINNGADVNVTHNGGGTPLHRAAREGHKQIVELLIANGAKCECAG
jgi:ankyrin repeat protein